ncbi:hypothetical protein GW17_00060854 [Ensete ventricosum]|nr:hypothetical protein GW17_00060854 [Ensete ventricosum]RZR91287.1 hypothetical protein BHM03_00019383 [Ensete ventricosum]
MGPKARAINRQLTAPSSGQKKARPRYTPTHFHRQPRRRRCRTHDGRWTAHIEGHGGAYDRVVSGITVVG